MSDKTPFSCWWDLYKKYCPRMDKKSKCEAKFNKYGIKKQRFIYQDTKDRIQFYDGWQTLSARGKREFMKGPHVYLCDETWDCPVDKKAARGNVRDTTKEVERPEQKLHGLQKMREMLVKAGLDTKSLDSQIEAIAN